MACLFYGMALCAVGIPCFNIYTAKRDNPFIPLPDFTVIPRITSVPSHCLRVCRCCFSDHAGQVCCPWACLLLALCLSCLISPAFYQPLAFFLPHPHSPAHLNALGVLHWMTNNHHQSCKAFPIQDAHHATTPLAASTIVPLRCA